MPGLGLRLRVFLFFAAMAVGALALAGGAMFLGWSRAEGALPTGPFLTAFIAFALVNTGLLLGIWLLFDENVAKPINRLSADLRMRVHAGVDTTLATQDARYLGDLAPAAAALTQKAGANVAQTAAHIARETERLGQEHRRLTDLLTQSPVATILINARQEIVLYDAQAAALLGTIAAPRLRAPLSDYFQADSLAQALSGEAPAELRCQLQRAGAGAPLAARVRALDEGGHMLFFDPEDVAETTIAPRPLAFDFGLLQAGSNLAMEDRPLSELCFVVLDLETTGLSVERDKIVEIGAVRVVNGAAVEGEVLSTYVNPGCPIPPGATRIHRITDAQVADAPSMSQAGRELHNFARDAVLVAHNAPFDIGLLKRNAAELGVSWDHPVLDTVLLSAIAFGTNDEHALDALCDRLGIAIPPKDRHTALGDARATASALICLLEMLNAQGYTTLATLRPAMEREARRLYASAPA